MRAGALSLAAFYLVGDRSGLPADESGHNHLRPVLFADYRDLSRLRYDYPLILVEDDRASEWLRSLTDVINTTLQRMAPQGIEGEETRRQVLSLEQEISNLVAQGQTGSLSLLWEKAAQTLLCETNGAVTAKLQKNLEKAYCELGVDGEIIDCTVGLPNQLIKHAWQQSQQVKAMQLCSRIERLIQKLSDILRVNDLHSSGARDAVQLKNSLGTDDSNVFDFQAMARILKSVPVGEPLPEKRLQRIKAAIAVLESQEFVAANSTKVPVSFIFDDCSVALAAFQQRLPTMATIVKAISIAELEIENRYDEARHDFFYGQFDEHQLGPGDLGLFPSYLVCLQDGDDAANEQASIELLRSGLPFKIMVQSNNIVGELGVDTGQLSCGIRGQQLANMAMGLNNVFVLQSSVASLYQLREQVMQGLSSDRPALFSVYSGMTSHLHAAEEAPQPYLLAAAANESRAFPCFVYDPAAGQNLASRFHLDGNPGVDNDWCRHTFRFEDAQHNIHFEETAFTLVDFMACDKRFAQHFVSIPSSDWSSNMLPVDSFLELDPTARADNIPYVLLIDVDNVLHRAVCDGRLIDAAQRCRELWRNLQELGGVNNSHVSQALAKATQVWEQELRSAQLPTSVTLDTTAAAAVTVLDAAVVEQPQHTVVSEVAPTTGEQPEKPSDEDPWIETIRCTTCNECTELNDRMFAYNEDKRAYIADPDAGTFRELVEAAETCQVAIIHPGKPRNPDESGLDDLMQRAQSFNQ